MSQHTTFPQSGGDMGAQMRATDWSATPLGPPDSWPLSLKTTVRIALDSRYAMWFGWGKELTFFCNDAYAPTLGIKKAWAIGASAPTVWAEIWPDVRGRVEQVMHGGPATWDEGLMLIVERSGAREETYHSFSYSPLPDDLGRVGGMLCVVTEETGRVISERRASLLGALAAELVSAKRESDVVGTFCRQLTAGARDLPFCAIHLTDPATGRTTLAGATGFADPAAAAAVAWPLEPVLDKGRPLLVGELATLVNPVPTGPWDRPPVQVLMMPIMIGGSRTPAGVFVAGLNPYRPFDEAYEGFLNLLVGQLAAALASARSLEAERRRIDELARLDRAKTTFFSNVSHELRTPLTLMLAPMQNALESDDGTLRGEDFGLVYRNQARLMKLVNSLLDFARIEAGRLTAFQQPTDLAGYTADLASNFRSAAERGGLKLVVLCPRLPEPVHVDPGLWEKIVLNLLSNALKYTLAGSIEVSVTTERRDAVLRVRDTGIGIPANELPKLFDRFHRVEGAQGRSHEGTGIGLALVRELVLLHAGTVTVSSQLGKGSVFTVRVPLGVDHLAAGQLSANAAQPPRRDAADSFVKEVLTWMESETATELPATADDLTPADGGTERRSRVLVADDNADMRNYIRRLLASHWDVSVVSDGQAALEAIQRDPPDLLVSDVMMPRLDGFQLLQAIRGDAATASLPVLLLSARAGEEARVEGMEAGADDYLTKPFTARELIVRIAGLLSMARARRDSLRREMALKERTIDVLESIQEAYVAFDADWRYTYANAAAESVLGLKRDQLLGRPLWEILPELTDLPVAATLRAAMLARKPVHFESFVTPWRRWFENHAYPLDDGGLSVYFRDVTERKQTLLALQEADRRKDEFIAMLAHELRNPLAPIQTASAILSSPKLEARQIAFTRSVLDRQVKHMARLLDDLLDVSRITRGRLEMKIVETPLDTVLDTALETSRGGLDTRQHQLVVQRPAPGARVRLDPVRIAQMLANLLNNAGKYTPTGGHITLEVRIDDEDLLMEVGDNGIGLAREHQRSVFDMFSQVHASGAHSQGGLGIGLALVRGVVELHGGSVEVTSAGVGHGSRFSVRLPGSVLAGPVRPHDAPHGSTDADDGSGLHILVADDNADAGELLAEMLRMSGHRVECAIDGLQAVAMGEQRKPDVAVLDIGMPGLSGYEVAQRLRQRWGDTITLIAVTGWGQPDDRRRAIDAGFDHHLVKPADPEALLALLA